MGGVRYILLLVGISSPLITLAFTRNLGLYENIIMKGSMKLANLTNAQRNNLLNLANQLSQNMTNDTSGLSENLSINLPGFSADAGLNLGFGSREEETDVPGSPTTMRDVLLNLVNEQVEVTTPFGSVTGTLIAVRNDYIVLVEATGAQTLVRMENIELVNEL